LVEHKFRVGQVVRMRRGPIHTALSEATYKVTRLLPATGMDNQYRLKALKSGQERVVREDEISAG
jgi:hypothetical protein